MARFDPQTGTTYKCICEALDLDWCTCSDEIRKEYNVTLPRPDELIITDEYGTPQ